MANIRGLKGFNPSTGTARLLAAYGQDIVNVTTGSGFGLNLNTSNDVEFESFLDRVFYQNFLNIPKTYSTSTNKWTNQHTGRTPRSKYIKSWKSKLYLGYCGFVNPQSTLDENGNDVVFPSRVFCSDLFSSNDLTWGIEWGRNGAVRAGSPFFYLNTANNFINQDFKFRNIKVGDPLTIVYTPTAANQSALMKTWTVARVQSPFILEMTENFPVSDTDGTIDYWVGGNWFDVAADDGDVLTGFGENNDRFLIFKLMSLWFYTGSQLKQVKGAPGTSYNRSIINDNFGNTYYFHGSDPKITGIYKYNGVSAVKISRAIDPWILGMDTSNYDNVVAWSEGNELRWYIGNLSANNYIEAINNVVITFNVDTGAWSVDPIQDVITATSPWRTSGVEDTYAGTADNQVLQLDDGNSQNGTPFTALLDTKVYYPSGTEVINEYPYIQVIARSGRGTVVKYKLWDNPTDVDQDWLSLGELDGDKTEFVVPPTHNKSSGIQLRFSEMGLLENDTYIEKISIFYRVDRSRLL